MPRENIMPNSSARLFEVYNDFSGGVNSEITNERLKDNEYPVFDNIDLSGRGSLRRRFGRLDALTSYPIGLGQGVFFYFRTPGATPDIVLAVNGKLYLVPALPVVVADTPTTGNGVTYTTANPWLKAGTLVVRVLGVVQASTLYSVNYSTGVITFNAVPAATPSAAYSYEITPLVISGMGGDFQNTLMIEAVQYKTVLYIATGTKFSMYDGTSASVVTPYAPTPQEAIFIGTNGLAANPSQWITDGAAATLQIAGIAPATSQATVQQVTTMTCYVNKPVTVTSIQYKWEYKKSSETTWTVGQAFATDGAGKTYSFRPDTATTYDIRVTIHDFTGGVIVGSDIAQALTNYAVGAVLPTNQLVVSSIQTCTKIMLHWDRLLLTKDSTLPFQVYVSDLQNGAYFPVSATMSFDTGKREPITSLVRFRDLLLIFTKTTVHSLSGKDPSTYSKSLVHDVFGCISDRSVQVVGNIIVFLSSEGIMQLTPNLFLSVFTVKRIDYQIRSAIPQDALACSAVFDNTYWICFPSQSIIYRYYYEVQVWVRDTSPYLNFTQFLHYGASVYNQTQDGKLYLQNKTIYYDVDTGVGAFKLKAESKYLSLEATFNYKKLKHIYILAKHFPDHTVDIGVEVRADSAIVLTPVNGVASIDANGNVIWTVTTAPNVHYATGTVLGYAPALGTASIDAGGNVIWTTTPNPTPPPTTPGLAQWILGITALGIIELSAQKATITGKCRRVKIIFTHSQPLACEIYGFGLEFRLKRP